MADVVDCAATQSGIAVTALAIHPDNNPEHHITQKKSSKDQNPKIALQTINTTPVEPEGSFRSRLLAGSSSCSRITQTESFGQSTEYLVHQFMIYRLRQSGCVDVADFFPKEHVVHSAPRSWRTLTGGSHSRTTGPCQDVQKASRALQLLCDDFDTTYWFAFQHSIPGDWLELNDLAAIKNKFFTLSRDLYFNVLTLSGTTFKEKISWGRIIVHFCFTAQLACLAVSSNRPGLVSQLADWFTQFITRYLVDWIQSNGGWEGLINCQETLSLPKKFHSTMLDYALKMGMMAALGAGVVFGLVMVRRLL